MPTFSWYRQKRVDGGIRTAIEMDDVIQFHLFEHRSDKPDPRLLWYVDLRCNGKKLPRAPQKVQQWLVAHAVPIRAGLVEMAQQFAAGVDLIDWPLQHRVQGLPRGITATIVVSALRRVELLELGQILGDVADHWEERLRGLPQVEPDRVG